MRVAPAVVLQRPANTGSASFRDVNKEELVAIRKEHKSGFGRCK